MNGDEEPIHSYSRARAISDGVLVDVTVLAGQAEIKHPTAVTQAVIEKCVRVPDGMSDQDEAGRLREPDEGELYTRVSRLRRRGCESDRFKTRQGSLDWVATKFPDIPEEKG